jgi:GDP-L-fucose synthase
LYERIDKLNAQISNLIPAITHKIHKANVSGKLEMQIWSDVTAQRELMYAGDFAAAVPHCMQDFSQIHDLKNIGLGLDYNIR